MRQRITTSDDDKQETTDKTRSYKKDDSLRIVYEIPQKITTSQEAALVAEVGDLRLLIRSKGATRKFLRAASRRPVSDSSFERSVWFLRGQESMSTMRFSLQSQNPFLLVHDTEELLEKVVTLDSFARADDNQLRPSTSERDV